MQPTKPMDISFDWQHEWKRNGVEDHGMPHVVHRLSVYGDEFEGTDVGAFEDGELGYMKVAYVPEDLWKEAYTGAVGFLRWAEDWEGWGFSDKRSIDNAVKVLSQKLKSWHDWDSADEIAELSFSEKVDRFERYLAEARKRTRGDYEESYGYNADKPEPDFVAVAKEHQCKGIGARIYEKAAQILADEYNFPLYSSTLRSEAAEAVWQKLDEKHGVDTIELESGDCELVRYVLDFR